MSKKLIPTILTAAAIAGSFGVTFALANNSSAAKNDLDEVKIAQVATTGDTSLTGSLVDETVYVFAKTDGSVRKTISSDWTKNSLGVSEYKKTEGNVKTPIEMKVSYTLDGEEISAKDLKGKSGKVTISYDYKNTEKTGGLFVPYAVMTGLMLDNNVFENVEVEGGKLVNDGDKSIVAGVAFPGMSENLGIGKSTISIPSSLKVTADVKGFKLGMAMSIATSEIFDSLDTSSFNSVSSLTGELGKLTGGMDQLISGSSALYNGLSELNDKSGALVSGIDQLTAGATSLKTGLAQIKEGASDLNTGLNSLAEQNNALTTGATRVKAGLFQLASGKLASDLTAAGAPAQIIALAALTEENYTDNLATITEKTGSDTSDLKMLLDGAVSLNAGITNYTGYVALMANKAPNLTSGATAAYAGAEKLESGLATLNAKTPALTDGITKLKNGSGDLKNGLDTFNQQGVERLVSAAGSIENLASRLKNTVNLAKAQKPIKYVYRIDEIK
ncbi:hypothetical protein IJJ18_00275 [Candidatus Saccharibacteria bacterium]|nr:hypothetical protein [Candidatus Saccharibacteria bacterium]